VGAADLADRHGRQFHCGRDLGGRAAVMSKSDTDSFGSVVDRVRARRPRARATDSTRRANTIALPVVRNPAAEWSPQALWTGSIVHCKRLLIGWMRDPETTIQTLAYPAVTLIMFRLAFGDTVTAYSGQSAVYGTVPLLMLVAAMSGAMVSGIKLVGEYHAGLLSRFATLPTHRASGLVGRLLAEALRVLVTSLFLLFVGLFLGFRFTQGPLAAVAMLALPVMFGTSFAIVVTALAAVTRDPTLVSLISIVNTLLMFFNSGFVPVSAYPSWLQDPVKYQPMSCVIDAMHGLAGGGAIAEPLALAVAWSVGMVLLFLYPAIRLLRRAAETSG
jgi:ABC-2 type transport system permease protein